MAALRPDASSTQLQLPVSATGSATTATAGCLRYNESSGHLEIFDGATWNAVTGGGGAPSGPAGGDLGGTYPNPTVVQARGLRETAGPTTLTMGAVANGQMLVRSGTTMVGQNVPSSGLGGSTGGTDNAVLRADGTGGSTVQNSLVTISDAGSISLPGSQTVDGRDVSVDGSTLDAHVANTSNPHSTTAAQVGAISNANGGISGLTNKSIPSASDTVAINDAAASNALKQTTIGQIATTVLSGGAFDPAVSINPRHYWRASNTVQSGGFVDTIVDFGRVGGKNFTSTGTARCPTATDGSGRTYLAPDGTNDVYTAGAASDWKFLNDGSQWTVGMVWHQPAAIIANQLILDTSNSGATASTGFFLMNRFTSSTSQGPRGEITFGTGGTFAWAVDASRPVNVIVSTSVRFSGFQDVAIAGPVHLEMVLRHAGQLLASCARINAPNNSNPANALKLFGGGAGTLFSNCRLYEIWIDDSSVPDRLMQSYDAWANLNYGAAG